MKGRQKMEMRVNAEEQITDHDQVYAWDVIPVYGQPPVATIALSVNQLNAVMADKADPRYGIWYTRAARLRSQPRSGE
jgi:hypothetical protein